MSPVSIQSLDQITPLFVGLIVIYGLVWLFNLFTLLDREDMTSVNRFMWVFILVMVPFFGLLLYWTSRGAKRWTTESDLSPRLRESMESPPVVGVIDCPRCSTMIQAEQSTCSNCGHSIKR